MDLVVEIPFGDSSCSLKQTVNRHCPKKKKGWLFKTNCLCKTVVCVRPCRLDQPIEFKNPNWLKANWLAVYKVEPKSWTQSNWEQNQWGGLELGTTRFQVWYPDHLATLPLFYLEIICTCHTLLLLHGWPLNNLWRTLVLFSFYLQLFLGDFLLWCIPHYFFGILLSCCRLTTHLLKRTSTSSIRKLLN